MRILITLITSLCLSLPTYADLSVNDLPYIEGTPLETTSEEDSTWTLLDYAEADGSLVWAWLENAGALAYVVYPSSSEAVVFPDGETVDSVPENMVLRFLGDDDQRLEFTRLGGSVVLEGRDISMVYTAAPLEFTVEGLNFELSSSRSIKIRDAVNAATLAFHSGGEIVSIQGSGSYDTFAHPATPNTDGGWALSLETSPDTLTPNPTCLRDNSATISSVGAGNISSKSPCSGDFLFNPPESLLVGFSSPDLILLNTSEIIYPAEIVPVESTQTQSASQKKSSGGNTSGLILGFLALLTLFRRKLS